MNTRFKRAIEQFIPFIFIGIGIALVIGLLIMFSYVVIWGILIGGIIWLITLIKNYFSSPSQKESSGRVIEHDDKKEE